MYHHAKRIAAATILLGLVAILVGSARPRTPQKDQKRFFLQGYDETTINTKYYGRGTLTDHSTARIVTGGQVYGGLTVVDSATVNMSGTGQVWGYFLVAGSGTAEISELVQVWGHLQTGDSSIVRISSGVQVWGRFLATGSSTVNITGGSVMNEIEARDSSTVNMSGGRLRRIQASESSLVNMSGGWIDDGLTTCGDVEMSGTAQIRTLGAFASSTVDISGGKVRRLSANESSTVNISDASVDELSAGGSSTVTFHARDFDLGSGLSLEGDRVLGTGQLDYEPSDGYSRTVKITSNLPTVTIRVSRNRRP